MFRLERWSFFLGEIKIIWPLGHSMLLDLLAEVLVHCGYTGIEAQKEETETLRAQLNSHTFEGFLLASGLFLLGTLLQSCGRSRQAKKKVPRAKNWRSGASIPVPLAC